MPSRISLCIDTVSLDDIDSQLAIYCPTIVRRQDGAKRLCSLFALLEFILPHIFTMRHVKYEKLKFMPAEL